MKKLFLILFILFFSSCTKDYFFSDFDTVEYYTLKNDSLIDYDNKGDSIAIEILNNDYPSELNNKEFYKVVQQQKFLKKIIKNNDVAKLNEIFTPTYSIVFSENACIPNYRDILIFKKNSSVVGLAKICLECKQYHFVGSNQYLNVDNFGNNENFEELNKIFKKYK